MLVDGEGIDEGLTNEIPAGFIILDKDKLSELEFDFGGFHLSNFSVETRKDEKGSTIVIADIEGVRYQSVDWEAQLLDSDKKNSVGSANIGRDKDERLNFWFNGNIWEKGKFIHIGMKVINQ